MVISVFHIVAGQGIFLSCSASIMSTAAFPKRRETPGHRALPIVAFFASDTVAGRFFTGVQRYRRLLFEELAAAPADIERIVLISQEDLLEEHYNQLHVPNTRVLALTNFRFKDPRNDGAIYAYLPPDVPEELLDRMVDNALDHIHLVHTRHEVNQRLAGASQEIHELNQIGVALSAERDPDKLLEMILTKSREFTSSDAGSVYLVESSAGARPRKSLLFSQDHTLLPAQEEDARKHLRFKLAQNDSVAVSFREATMEINEQSIAGYAALTGEIVNLEDAYNLPDGVPYSINRKFDEDSGYRTKSILAVPIRNQKEKIIAVLQLINAKRNFATRLDSLETVEAQVLPYTAHQQEIVLSLAGQAAVALENSQLYDSIQRLFEGFVRAAVTAIEARDPATSGHSFRVANLTVALAESIDRAESGPFAAVRFSRDQMREIRYASLLHDFGKVGVRELEKALDARLAAQLSELDEYQQAVIRANEPTVLPEGNFDPLLQIANRHYLDFDGKKRPLLTHDEVQMLSIRKGSLDEEERVQIESHVLHTVSFLQQIPWTNELRNVPEIARGHHEKLNGTGYPYRLSAPEIPLQTRMMTIADIFDALAAADRPYKRAVSIERALEILGLSVQDGELDGGLFEVFKAARIFDRWKIEPSIH